MISGGFFSTALLGYMAILVEQKNHRLIPLKALHRVGRLAPAVNTLLDHPLISKLHAWFEWRDQRWYLRDLSRNGCWLNQKKMAPQLDYPLQAGDQICFGDKDAHTFMVEDLSPPVDMLVCTEPTEQKLLSLTGYHLFPKAEQAHMAVYYTQQSGLWQVEDIHRKMPARTLEDGDTVNILGQKWQLHLAQCRAETQVQAPVADSLNQLQFRFELSQDEEQTRLRLTDRGAEVDLQTRSHHYLTLNLARHRARDKKQGLNEEFQGWIYTEQLAKELGTNVNYLNILIHRARKQFSDVLQCVWDPEVLIQRQSGKLRFGGSLFEIYKGNQLEASFF